MVGVASSLPVLLRHASMGPSVMMAGGCGWRRLVRVPVEEGPTSVGEGGTVMVVLGSLSSSSSSGVSTSGRAVVQVGQSNREVILFARLSALNRGLRIAGYQNVGMA